MTFIQAACRFFRRIGDLVIPMKKLQKSPRFIDKDNGRAVYIYQERISGRVMMAHWNMSCFRVHHPDCPKVGE